MRSQPNYVCLRSRAMALSVGVATAILWLPLAYAMTQTSDFERAIENPSTIATLLCILTCSSVSVLMTIGVVKRNAGFLFPWLAIHFTLIVVGTAWTIALIIHVLDGLSIQVGLISAAIGMVVISLKVIFWSSVYLHYKDLHAPPMRVLPTCANEGKILKSPLDPINPYHPV